jgi:hypothetical protein
MEHGMVRRSIEFMDQSRQGRVGSRERRAVMREGEKTL